MNVDKSTTSDLIDPRPMMKELELNMLMGVTPYVSISLNVEGFP